MKKSRVILLVLLLLVTNLSSQNIVGTWQINSEIVGSGLNESYRLFENGNFEFVVSQYSYLTNLVSFNGIYKIQNNQICFVITSRKERVGTYVTQGSPAWQGNWILEGDDIKEVKQDSVTYCFDYSLTSKENQSILQIGNTTYYKIRKEDE